jgi:hypothetical protein
MSRQKREAERLARKREYRANRAAMILRTMSLSSDGAVRKTATDLKKQLDALPGKPQEKYMVVLRCSGNDFYSYPIYGCPDGFTAAMQDAIKKHQKMDRSEIEGGIVQGIGDTSFNPPDVLVQMMAMDVKVAVTNRIENRQSIDGELDGAFAQGRTN